MELKNLCCIVLPNLRTTGVYSVEHVCRKAILIFIGGVERKNKQTNRPVQFWFIISFQGEITFRMNKILHVLGSLLRS